MGKFLLHPRAAVLLPPNTMHGFITTTHNIMKLRLSNGVSYAIEFNAVDQIEFRKSMRCAAMEYFAHEGKRAIAELHVATDSGEWLSANYPKSNAPYYVKFGHVDNANWNDARAANSSGTWFEYELDCMAGILK